MAEYPKIYNSEEERIKASCDRGLDELLDKCSDERAKLVKRFINSYRVSGTSVHTTRNNVTGLRAVLPLIEKSIDDMTGEDLEDLLITLADSGKSERTLKSYTLVLKKFLEFAGREDLTKDMKIRRPRNKAKLPEDLLTREDVAALIDGALNPRDKALISLLYESGARLGEIIALKIKHIEFNEHGAYVHFPQGKTGGRKILVVFSSMYLNEWLITHPERHNRDSWLWCQIRGQTHPRITQAAFRAVIKNASKRAGIKKKINPHSFRHAQATELAKDFTEQQMKQYLGWTQDSTMAAVYVHLSGRDMDSAILQKNGIKVEERDTRLKADECPRCHKMIPPDAVYCGFCGLPLTKQIENREKDLSQKIAEILQNNPELLK